MKNTKNPQNSTDSKKTAKKGSTTGPLKVSPWLEDYLDCFSFKYRPVTEAFIERISSELVTWARTNQRAYKIRPFFSDKGISEHTYYDWRHKYPTFKNAYELAKAIIGDRREYGALENKLNATTVHGNLHLYDQEWKEALEYREKIKSAEVAKSEKITVILEPYPNSPLVPNKKEE